MNLESALSANSQRHLLMNHNDVVRGGYRRPDGHSRCSRHCTLISKGKEGQSSGRESKMQGQISREIVEGEYHTVSD